MTSVDLPEAGEYPQTRLATLEDVDCLRRIVEGVAGQVQELLDDSRRARPFLDKYISLQSRGWGIKKGSR